MSTDANNAAVPPPTTRMPSTDGPITATCTKLLHWHAWRGHALLPHDVQVQVKMTPTENSCPRTGCCTLSDTPTLTIGAVSPAQLYHHWMKTHCVHTAIKELLHPLYHQAAGCALALAAHTGRIQLITDVAAVRLRQ
jgi:hypothetical protein